MIWVVMLGLALAVLAVLLWLLRGKQAGWEALAAALMLGMAGYALQGSPNVPSAPKVATVPAHQSADAMVQLRQKMEGSDPTANKWLVVGDALARQGQYGDAVTILRGAVQAQPNFGEGWLALGNALVGHAQGNLSPAALYAFRKAAAAEPKSPAPAFFLGLAMAQAGRFDETKGLWAQSLAQTPPDAPWRGELEDRMVKLDKLLAMIKAQEQGDVAQVSR
ncbi:cytochrome C biosynthesis protein [Novosphingobium umbonatum]|uniref:Cytochrome C biosynthesis protein n=1 Tax=Novosphingobium umbonatum TaxID=1908524 RepID=A0A437N869_9SPHN|nr:tetratricopeptide repeat protein [Novosphingobium umbonatum]RVU06125.1 cytochrome C biosynthesis protein [Novosphingobium umbonatum]